MTPTTLKALAERLRTSYGLNRIPVCEEAASLSKGAQEGVERG